MKPMEEWSDKELRKCLGNPWGNLMGASMERTARDILHKREILKQQKAAQQNVKNCRVGKRCGLCWDCYNGDNGAEGTEAANNAALRETQRFLRDKLLGPDWPRRS